ncbi:MAG: hypothetical protein K2G63_07425 [Oscillospiraceae bacterium]|nr:hypothetical protein [Oscillospiraceae bacterium]
MKKFVPYEKMSKKEQHKINKEKRNVWEINPVTRKTENKKAYNRKKLRRDDKSQADYFLFSI